MQLNARSAAWPCAAAAVLCLPASPAVAAFEDVGNEAGHALVTFGTVMIGLFFAAGAFAWLKALFTRGPRALLGLQKTAVPPFENVVFYRRGQFIRVLTPGMHWVPTTHCHLIRVDMRPEAVQIAQGTVTTDRIPVVLRCLVRIQLRDPKAAVESASNYRAELQARLQSLTKKIGEEHSLRDLHSEQEALNAKAKDRAAKVLGPMGVECLDFELMQTEASNKLPELESREFGFRAGA